MYKNHKGFTLVETLLLIVIAGLVGFIAWYVYHTKNTANKTYTSTVKSNSPGGSGGSSQSTNTQTAKYLDISELGIKVPVVGIDDLVYKYTSNNKYFNFSTKSLAAADSACGLPAHPFGEIHVLTQRSTNEGLSDDQEGELLTHINGYYVYHHTAQISCSSNQKVNDLLIKLTPTFVNAMINAWASS